MAEPNVSGRARRWISVGAVFVLSWTSVARADTSCALGTTPIPDGFGSATRTIEVPASSAGSSVATIELTVSVVHPWIGDLRLVLRDPSGLEVVVLDRPGIPSVGFPGPWGCGGDDIVAAFTDLASVDAESTCSTTAVPVLSGSVKPLEALSAFQGRPAAGTWTLIASDLASVDAGALGSVCLTVAVAPHCPADLDANGAVDGADLAVVLGGWGPCTACAADLDADGAVGGGDLAIVLGAWGLCGGGGA